MKHEAESVRVLLVDDNAISLNLMRRILSEEDVEAVTLTDAEEAIHLINAGGFDAVFVDLRMSPVSGLDVLRRTNDSPNRRYVLTGYADLEEESQALSLGAAEVLHKPLEVEYVLRLIRG